MPDTPQSPYEAIDAMVRDLIATVASYMKADPRDIEDRIWSAYIFAREAHEGQYRRSGEPYITHPLEATRILLIVKPDIISIQSCILHDVIEDTPHTKEDIEKNFGKDVAEICEGLSKLEAIKYRGDDRTIGSLRKMLLAMVGDMRVIIVKLADRLHNMQTLEHHPTPEKRRRIALETLNIYAPIADRLGIFRFKEMLETECFKHLEPEAYAKIQGELDGLRSEQHFFIEKAEKMIREYLGDSIPVIEISHRIKAPYSIYKKLERKGFSYKNTEDLYDLFAIRIITDSISHCYEILGILHNIFTPMPKRFKDYIALPKENQYQSLHTTVVGMFPELRQQPTEIQIRTREMHQQAEIGVAAHFEYSEKGKSSISQESYWVATIKNILDSSEVGSEFMDEMKMNVFSDQIFVFTPKGDIITLPKGATPVDFAYAIHSNIGNHLTIAKVNGHVVSLDSVLRNGESIQVVTDIHKKPNPSWLAFVKTSRARDHIRHFINESSRDILIEKGKSILNTYLDRNYGSGLDKELSLLRMIDGRELDTKQREDTLVQIGNLSTRPSALMRLIHDGVIRDLLGTKKEEKGVETKKKEKKNEEKGVEKIIPAKEESVIIGGERDIPYKFANCCHVESGDRIMASIGSGGILVHRFDCENVSKVGLDRRIPAYWSTIKKTGVTIEVECTFRDKKGLLRQITDILYRMGLNIDALTTHTLSDGLVMDHFTLSTDEEDYYITDRLTDRLQLEIPEFIEAKLIKMS